jgi:hypothetical protein
MGSKALGMTKVLKAPMEIHAKILRRCLGLMGVWGESWFLMERIMMVCVGDGWRWLETKKPGGWPGFSFKFPDQSDSERLASGAEKSQRGGAEVAEGGGEAGLWP